LVALRKLSAPQLSASPLGSAQEKMKVLLLCIQCVNEKFGAVPPFLLSEVRDDSVYEINCPNGHRNKIVLGRQKFETLFDIAATAILDGYYREAVSTFSSSLERFQEYFVRVITTKYRIPDSQFDLSWKLIAKQSERQLGAFIYSYLFHRKQSPRILSQGSVTFRNSVVHQGKIPIREEALAFGAEVYSIIINQLRQLKKDAAEEIKIVDKANIDQMRIGISSDILVYDIVGGSIINTLRDYEVEPPQEFHDILKEHERAYLSAKSITNANK
jgi:hypothetical protein